MGFDFSNLVNQSVLRFTNTKFNMPALKIGDSIAKLPIIQGGMGVGISLSKLASSVAEIGGIGVIAANAIGMIEPDYYEDGKAANVKALRKEIRKARELSDGIIGVNIMVALNDFHNLLRVSIEEKVDMVFLGAGLPLRNIPVADLRKAKVKVVPIVSSARAAKLIFKYWGKNYNTIPDAVVVEGPLAGGHLGFKVEEINDPNFSLENIIKDVIEEIKVFEKEFNISIPVIAAGGIFDSKDIYKYLKLGASGVQMGSRFVATDECDADLNFKKAFIESKKEDMTIINSPVGMPGRAIKNNFISNLRADIRKPVRCSWRCLESCKAKDAKYCISEALNKARLGDLEEGFAFAGSNAYKINKIVPVGELLHELKEEYKQVAMNETENLREQYNKALNKFISLKEEYKKAVEKGVERLREELEGIMGKRTKVFKEKNKTMMSFDKLVKEYTEYFERVKDLKDQLLRFFDASAFELLNI